MSGEVITIIGGGASSVSFIYAFLKGLARHGCHSNLSIFLVDKQSQCGRGLAYSEDCGTNILNTRAEFISPFPDQSGHFYRWLLANREIWEDGFLILSYVRMHFYPDPYLGYILRTCFNGSLKKL